MKRLALIAVLCLLSGVSVGADFNEAKARAETGDKVAQFDLALTYQWGTSVPTNYAEALKWYLDSAKQGYAPAQFCVGSMYSRSEGVKQNNSESYEWSTIYPRI